jgi:hypothetical protein
LGRGCLFWLVASIVLSVTLTIILNLGLFALGVFLVNRAPAETRGVKRLGLLGTVLLILLRALAVRALQVVHTLLQLIQSPSGCSSGVHAPSMRGGRREALTALSFASNQS